MLNLHKHNWENMNIEQIIGGKTADNTRYLQLFLKDYSKEFNITTLNAGCNKCIKDYLRKYKSKFNNMDNNSNYVLHKKREGIQLGFGSSVFVNNDNITDKYAEQLIKRYKKSHESKGEVFELSYLFCKFPKEEIKPVETTQVPKKKRTRKNKK